MSSHAHGTTKHARTEIPHAESRGVGIVGPTDFAWRIVSVRKLIYRLEIFGLSDVVEDALPGKLAAAFLNDSNSLSGG